MNHKTHKAPTPRIKFTPQEDTTLKYLIKEFGCHDWKRIASMMPGRNPKQCRDRFTNYLSDIHIEGPWQKEEDEILLSLLSIIGRKWVEISQHIPGRTGNDCKNRWYKHLYKSHPNFANPPQTNQAAQTQPNQNNYLDHIDVQNLNIESPISKPWEQYKISALLV